MNVNNLIALENGFLVDKSNSDVYYLNDNGFLINTKNQDSFYVQNDYLINAKTGEIQFLNGGLVIQNWTPLNLVATVVSDTAIDLTWTGGKLAKVERSTDGINFTQIGTGTDSYSDTGLTAGTLYYYRVKGGVYSSVVNGVTDATQLRDGHTVALYDTEVLSTVTKDNSNRTTLVTDKLLSGNNIASPNISAVLQNPVHWKDGITLNGFINDLKGAFIFNQPELIFMVLRLKVSSSSKFIFDGNADNSGCLYTDNPGGVDKIGIGAGSWPAEEVAVTINKWVILRILFNGALSKVKVNDTVSGDLSAGVLNMGGFTLGKAGISTTSYSNYTMKLALLRDSVIGETELYNQLKLRFADLLAKQTYVSPWVRQGVVLSSADALDKVSEPALIYDGAGDWKMYHSGGGWGSAIPEYIGYGTSVNGTTWVNHLLSPVINGWRPTILKHNGVYYLYVIHMPFIGGYGTQFDLYTSTDGVAFTLDTAAVLTKSAGGWDNISIDNRFVWIEGTTWYMMYEGLGHGGFQTGLATSTDGHGRAWTKHGSNPVISLTRGNGRMWVKKIGLYYYMWSHNAELPMQIYRMRSLDLITWEQYPAPPVFNRRGINEGEFNTNGQSVDPFLVEANNKVYLYYNSQVDGNNPDTAGDISCAIADMTIDQLVLTDEDAGL